MNDRSYDPSHEEIEGWRLDKEAAEDAAWRASRRKASAEVEQAIDLSIRENRTVVLAGEADDWGLLYDGLMGEAEDSVDFKDVAEFWGVTEGEKWRVDLLKSGE